MPLQHLHLVVVQVQPRGDCTADTAVKLLSHVALLWRHTYTRHVIDDTRANMIDKLPNFRSIDFYRKSSLHLESQCTNYKNNVW